MSASETDPRTTDRTTRLDAHTARLARYLERLSQAGFYGKVVITFQNGKVGDVKIEQTKKLEEL